MKKLAILSMTLLFSFSVIYGQTVQTEKEQVKTTEKELKSEKKALRKLEGTTVGEQAKTSFSNDFMGAKNVESKRIDTFDEFKFTGKNGKQMKAYYDYEGKLVGTTENMTFADLPATAQKDIKARYKDYTIGQVFFFDDNEANQTDMIFYSKQFDDADNYFVELIKGTKKIILQVNTEGAVFFYTELK
jgi:hypothetical protein